MSNPTLDPFDHSLRRYFVDQFFEEKMTLVPAGSLVLDLGGHKFAKRGRFDIDRYDVRVLYANLSTDKGTDFISDAGRVAAAAGQFDVVVCGELLEHVKDPRRVVHEAFRLLKPGGRFLATVPFLFRIHADPADYGRYTPYFWQETLADTGFENILIEHQGYFFAVMATNLEQFINRGEAATLLKRKFRGILTRALVKPLKRAAVRHEGRPRIKNDPFMNSYSTGFGLYGEKCDPV